jgi:hypothetical protein
MPWTWTGLAIGCSGRALISPYFGLPTSWADHGPEWPRARLALVCAGHGLGWPSSGLAFGWVDHLLGGP